AKITIVLQKHETVARRKSTAAVIGLERDLATFLAASQPLAVLQGRSDIGIDGANISTTMGHGDTGAIRTLFAVGKIVP
ncbi:hypothetical protein, partial [Pseudomonas kitaguniensis]|uniref:hypothetical protein n=1 Tax=Pseudomonas kitaguniensis TaxID=2607908 RepID=UPI003CFEC89A